VTIRPYTDDEGLTVPNEAISRLPGGRRLRCGRMTQVALENRLPRAD